MKQRIIAYTKKVDELLDNIQQVNDIDDIIDEHLIQIGFFQHERLVHLLVTLAFAFLTIGVIVYTAIKLNLLFAFAGMLLLGLLICYVMHYFLLENQVQKMYFQYDKMLQEKRNRKISMENKDDI